jgi:Fe-S oxidoreductase
LFYAGCTYSFDYPDVLKSTIGILQRANIEVQYLQEKEECCGIMLYDGGYLEEFQAQVETNIKRFEEAGIDLLVTPCPGCFGMIKREYSKFANYNFRVQHFTEFLIDLINQGKLELKNYNATVTWHDPCHLSRKMRIFDQPRQIIEAIPGLKFKEMPNTKYDSFCCGAGGAVLASRADVSIKLAKRRILEAKEIEADIILTMCPACESILEKAIRYLAWDEEKDDDEEDFDSIDSSIKLMDLSTLISQCIL